MSIAADTSDQESGEDAVATAQLEVSQKVTLSHAIQTAEAIDEEQKIEATDQAIVPFRSDLPNYGVDPDQGELGWIHPPLIIDIEGYQQFDYGSEFPGTVVQDIVTSADITWNTDYGTSGCGFILHSDGNQDSPNQYMTLASLGANGHVVFATMAYSEVVTGQDIYAHDLDPNFQWKNDTTNRIAIVDRGDRFTIYTSDTSIGEIDPSATPPQPYIPPPQIQPEDLADNQTL